MLAPLPISLDDPQPSDYNAPVTRAFWVMELWCAQFKNPAFHIPGHQLDCPEDDCSCKLNAQSWKRKVVLNSNGTYSMWSFKKYKCKGCSKSCYGVDPRVIASLPVHLQQLLDADLFRKFSLER